MAVVYETAVQEYLSTANHACNWLLISILNQEYSIDLFFGEGEKMEGQAFLDVSLWIAQGKILTWGYFCLDAIVPHCYPRERRHSTIGLLLSCKGLGHTAPLHNPAPTCRFFALKLSVPSALPSQFLLISPQVYHLQLASQWLKPQLWESQQRAPTRTCARDKF